MEKLTRILLCLLSLKGSVQANSISSPCDKQHCMAVVDAGSSGTRVHIYSYNFDIHGDPIDINELEAKLLKPGFSTLELKQATIDVYLSRLLNEATHKNIPLYFYSTAGMRLKTANVQQAYYTALKKWFTQHNEWMLIAAKTITGKEEGMYGWLAINYRIGALEGKNDTVGVMDMGGASVQISFPIANGATTDKEYKGNLVEVNLYGRHTTVFTYSFLGLGQTLLSQQYLDNTNCYSKDYELPSAELSNGDALACQKSIAKLINGVHGVHEIVSPMMSVKQSKEWYAIGNIAKILTDKPFEFSSLKFTPQNLLQQADKKICHKSLTELDKQFPGDEFVHDYCLVPAYYYALIVDGYGLQPNTNINLMENPTCTGWTLGVIVNSEVEHHSVLQAH